MDKMSVLLFVAVSSCYVRCSEGPNEHEPVWILMRSASSISRKFKDAGMQAINQQTKFADRFGGKRCDEHVLRIVVSDIAHKHFIEKSENVNCNKAREQQEKLENLVFTKCVEKN